jgi:hypothetical protein
MTHTKDEALKLALDALTATMSTHGFQKQIDQAKDDAIDAIRKALSAPVQEHDVAFLRQVLSVAIAGLYQHYKDDVLRVFTLDDLQTVVDLADPLQSQQVEDIYKRAWEMLATPPAQPAPVSLTDEQIELVAKWLETQAVTTPTNGPLLANALRYVGAYVITKGQP